ncbi:c-type cytochrome [Roseateles sp. DC23W]|uniref:C-type cytochrome n=1 Tax=Pelomonas dachongensis TaxID=3299029 RepID=A0ABW7ENG3_9BURK
MLLKTLCPAPLGAILLFALLGTGAAVAQPAADAASITKGKRLYMRCAACHDTGDTGPARIGPHLKGLVGRPMGSVPGYNYSAAMKAKSLVWNEAQLNAWLVKPTAVVPGTTMAFAGMPDAAERKALIDYLRSLK